MRSSSQPIRWPLVILLGATLGCIYVWLGLALEPSPRAKSGSRRPEIVRVTPVERRKPLFPSDDDVREELTGVVTAQLAAFRSDNYPGAYHLAAAVLRDSLPLPAFEKMVRTSYPAIAHSRSVSFGPVLDNGREAVVNVIILSESRQLLHYQYRLRNERSGWRIDGVVESKTPSPLASRTGQAVAVDQESGMICLSEYRPLA